MAQTVRKVLNPLGGLEAAMREQAVIADADAEVDGQNPENRGYGESAPAEVKERGNGADVEGADEACGDPVDAAVVGFAAHANFFANGYASRQRSCWTAEVDSICVATAGSASCRTFGATGGIR